MGPRNETHTQVMKHTGDETHAKSCVYLAQVFKVIAFEGFITNLAQGGVKIPMGRRRLLGVLCPGARLAPVIAR